MSTIPSKAGSSPESHKSSDHTPSLPFRSTITDDLDRTSDLHWWPARKGDKPSTTEPSTVSAGDGPKVIVVFICGNPGLIEYYTPFLSSIHRTLPAETTTVYGLSHLAQSPSHPIPYLESLSLPHIPWVGRHLDRILQSVFGRKGFRGRGKGLPSLDEQVEHKIRFFDWLDGEYGGRISAGEIKTVVIGHSVGSFIACKTLKARPHLISSLHLLFPTLSEIRQTPSGNALAPLFIRPLHPFYIIFQTLFLFLIYPFIHNTVRLFTGQDEPSSRVTEGLIRHPSIIGSCLEMARDEMEIIKELDREFFVDVASSRFDLDRVGSDSLKRKGEKVDGGGPYGDRCNFYFSSGELDSWVPDRLAKGIFEMFEGREDQGRVRRTDVVVENGSGEGLKGGKVLQTRLFRCDEGMPHSFCLGYSEQMAVKCSRWIREDFLD